jgi:N-acetylated-alpha-linked acidic dipeptidase
LQQNVVAYLNIDVSVSGNNFHGSASPSLANLLRDAALEIEHPSNPNRTLWEMQDGGNWTSYNADVKGLFDKDPHASSVNSIGIKALG